MRVRLTKRFAKVIDGVNLNGHMPGDVLNLPDRDAQILLAEQWAILERREQTGEPPGPERRRQNSPGSPPDHSDTHPDDTGSEPWPS